MNTQKIKVLRLIGNLAAGAGVIMFVGTLLEILFHTHTSLTKNLFNFAFSGIFAGTLMFLLYNLVRNRTLLKDDNHAMMSRYFGFGVGLGLLDCFYLGMSYGLVYIMSHSLSLGLLFSIKHALATRGKKDETHPEA